MALNMNTTFSHLSRVCLHLGIAFGIAILSSCSTKEEQVIPEGMCSIDLQRYGKPFSMLVPDTAKNPLSISEEASGALLVRAGKNFGLSIFEEQADLALKREDLKADEVNRLTAFISEEPNALFWESSITEPEFHFLVNASLGGRDFSFQDLQDPEAKLLSKASVQKMFEACKNIKAIEPKE